MWSIPNVLTSQKGPDCLVETEKHAQEDTKTRLDRDYPKVGLKVTSLPKETLINPCDNCSY